MSVKSLLSTIEPFVTLDGSTIRELMHPAVQGNRAQSLAQASVAPGQRTLVHYHRETEEIYFIQDGEGILELGDEEIAVSKGHSVLIPPGTHHAMRNSADRPLVFLCCCSPAYSDSDTFFP